MPPIQLTAKLTCVRLDWIISMYKILRFTNTFIIIIKLRLVRERSTSHQSTPMHTPVQTTRLSHKFKTHHTPSQSMLEED